MEFGGTLAKLLLGRKIKFEQGKIIAFDLPFFLCSMETIKEMTRDALKKDIKALTDLYFYGWVYGFVVTKNIVNQLKLKKFEERYKVCMDIMSVLGFGDYQTLSFKRADHAKFKVIGNPFALQFYKNDNIFCYFVRGIESGGGCWVHETLMNNVEFECAAQNGQYCLHANLAPHRIAELGEEFIKKQFDLSYLIEKETKFMKDFGEDPAFFGIE
ncbi:MAG: hypothetical protein N3D73_00660 [Candidatus Diapherotrites archaeon]|nr:hypothetical protein [Candidatus Diapherotrites archaeon]